MWKLLHIQDEEPFNCKRNSKSQLEAAGFPAEQNRTDLIIPDIR